MKALPFVLLTGAVTLGVMACADAVTEPGDPTLLDGAFAYSLLGFEGAPSSFDAGTPGFHVRRVVHTLRSSSYATELEFKDCWVSDHQVLGEVNTGADFVAYSPFVATRAPVFVGRQLELDTLTEAWEKTRAWVPFRVVRTPPGPRR